MAKIYGMIAAALVAIAAAAPAQAEIIGFDAQQLQRSLTLAARNGLNWHVGDKASYSINVGFIKGKSDNFVREDTGTAFWMVQDMDLMIQKQKVEALINKTNGQIEKLLVNGQEQSIPKEDMQVIDMHEDKVTVPAGSFDCIYAKLQNKQDQKITEAWINPKAVPMSGQLKVLGDTQLGKLTEELTSFQFAGQ